MTGDRIEVLHLIDGLGTGGSERSLAEMLPLFERHGFAVTVACLHSRPEGVEEVVREAGFDVRLLPSGSFLQRTLELRRLLHRERPNLIHTTHFASDLLGRLASAGTGIPVLSSLVNVRYGAARLGDPNLSRHRLAVVRQIDKWTARYLTTHFHAVSETAKRDAVRALDLPPERVSVIRRGRDPKRLPRPGKADRLRARRNLQLPQHIPVIVTVGRQEYQKGQQTLLKSMPHILNIYPDLVALIVGRKGHATAELERLHVSLGLASSVRFLGHRDDVPQVLAAADLFVFPSLYEGFPGAVIEAMASALPIVASNIPPLRELVREEENAVLVSPQSPTEMAEAVASLLVDPHRAAAFGRRSRQIFEAELTLEQAATGMANLYRLLTHERPVSSDRAVTQ